MFRTLLITALATLTLSPTLAAPAPLTPEALSKLPPPAQRAYVQKQVALQKARAALAGTDSTGPVLTTFDLASQVEPGQNLNVTLQVKDDLSGVQGMYAFASNGLGSLYVGVYAGYPIKNLKTAANHRVSRYQVPGTYVFEWGYAYDAAGNYTYYDAAALAALGNATVQVANTSMQDSQPPVFGPGRLMSTRVSLSGTHPGTDTPAYAGLMMTVTDTGEQAVSGPQWMGATFCQLDADTCFYLGDSVQAEGLANVKLIAGGQPASSSAPAGAYYLRWLYVYDWANNLTELTSTRFGGETDFTTLISNGDKIVLRN